MKVRAKLAQALYEARNGHHEVDRPAPVAAGAYRHADVRGITMEAAERIGLVYKRDGAWCCVACGDPLLKASPAIGAKPSYTACRRAKHEDEAS